MSSAVAPPMVTSERGAQAEDGEQQDRVERQRQRHRRARVDAAGTSSTSWMGVLIEGGVIDQSVCDLPAMNLIGWSNHLRDDHARDRGGGLGAEAAVLDGDGDDDRAAAGR